MKKKTQNSNTWQDHYTRQAKKEQYPARSVYKLKEIQQKFKIIHQGDTVLDLGCSPGAWLLYAAEMTGTGGTVMGIDLNPVSIKLPAHVQSVVGDVLSPDERILAVIGEGYHVVLSDMAPATTGMKDVDALRSYRLCEAALEWAIKRLIPGGSFVCKIFQGEDFKAFTELVRAAFNQQKTFKPQSSRKASKEIYIIGMGKK